MAKNKPKHVLLMRLSALGDVAMAIPVLLALREHYPQLTISFLSRPFYKPLLTLVPGLRFLPAEVDTTHRGLLGLWRLYRNLPLDDFSHVADLHNVLRTRVLGIFFRLKSLPLKRIDKARSQKKALTRPVNKLMQPLKTTHQRYAEVLGALDLPLQLEARHVLPEQPLSAATKKLLGSLHKPWVGIAPFAAHPGKEYPRDHMVDLLSLLNRQGYGVLLFGSLAEQVALEAMANTFENVVCVAGKLRFSEELALISHLDLLVGMDSGNGHLAAAFGVPVLTLWGVTHPYAGFAPYSQAETHRLLADREQYPLIPTSVYGNRCPPGYERAMETIKPETVFSTIRRLLNP